MLGTRLRLMGIGPFKLIRSPTNNWLISPRLISLHSQDLVENVTSMTSPERKLPLEIATTISHKQWGYFFSNWGRTSPQGGRVSMRAHVMIGDMWNIFKVISKNCGNDVRKREYDAM